MQLTNRSIFLVSIKFLKSSTPTKRCWGYNNFKTN
nr:MAG TPA: hypothetical protein [Caudoviricetes sp.]